MTRDPAWVGLWIRRRPGWERRIRARRLAAVILLCLLSLSGGSTWPVGGRYRILDYGRDGSLWYLTFTAWPDFDTKLTLLSYEKAAVDQADVALWRDGRKP